MELNLYEINEFNKEFKILNDSLNNEDNKKILENAQKRKEELNNELKEIKIHQIQNDGNLTGEEWLKKDFLEKEIMKHEETISKIEKEREESNKKIFEKRLQKEDIKRQLSLEEAQVEIELANIQEKWNEAISEINNNNEQIRQLRLANRELSEESEEAQNNLEEILGFQNKNEELKLIMQENVITSKKGMEIKRKQEDIKTMKNILESGAILEGIKNPNEQEQSKQEVEQPATEHPKEEQIVEQPTTEHSEIEEVIEQPTTEHPEVEEQIAEQPETKIPKATQGPVVETAKPEQNKGRTEGTASLGEKASKGNTQVKNQPQTRTSIPNTKEEKAEIPPVVEETQEQTEEPNIIKEFGDEVIFSSYKGDKIGVTKYGIEKNLDGARLIFDTDSKETFLDIMEEEFDIKNIKDAIEFKIITAIGLEDLSKGNELSTDIVNYYLDVLNGKHPECKIVYDLRGLKDALEKDLWLLGQDPKEYIETILATKELINGNVELIGDEELKEYIEAEFQRRQKTEKENTSPEEEQPTTEQSELDKLAADLEQHMEREGTETAIDTAKLAKDLREKLEEDEQAEEQGEVDFTEVEKNLEKEVDKITAEATEQEQNSGANKPEQQKQGETNKKGKYIATPEKPISITFNAKKRVYEVTIRKEKLMDLETKEIPLKDIIFGDDFEEYYEEHKDGFDPYMSYVIRNLGIENADEILTAYENAIKTELHDSKNLQSLEIKYDMNGIFGRKYNPSLSQDIMYYANKCAENKVATVNKNWVTKLLENNDTIRKIWEAVSKVGKKADYLLPPGEEEKAEPKKSKPSRFSSEFEQEQIQTAVEKIKDCSTIEELNQIRLEYTDKVISAEQLKQINDSIREKQAIFKFAQTYKQCSTLKELEEVAIASKERLQGLSDRDYEIMNRTYMERKYELEPQVGSSNRTNDSKANQEKEDSKPESNKKVKKESVAKKAFKRVGKVYRNTMDSFMNMLRLKDDDEYYDDDDDLFYDEEEEEIKEVKKPDYKTVRGPVISYEEQAAKTKEILQKGKGQAQQSYEKYMQEQQNGEAEPRKTGLGQHLEEQEASGHKVPEFKVPEFLKKRTNDQHLDEQDDNDEQSL